MMDRELEKRQHRFAHAEDKGDTTTMWRLITAAVEAAFIRHLQLDKKEVHPRLLEQHGPMVELGNMGALKRVLEYDMFDILP